jgi:hypothetical protein
MGIILWNVLLDTIQITLLVTVMMILVDLINVWTKGKIEAFLKGKAKGTQYVVAAFIGTVPGCIGGFTNVSLYLHGLISFGALSGSMISVSGDEAFVMLALFPKWAMILFAVLFVVGIFGGYLTDVLVKIFKMKVCSSCKDLVIHPKEKSLKHYLREHILNHIIKKHIWKTALWTFGALLVVALGLKYVHLEEFTSQYKIAFLFLGALVGLLPESGPHLIFVTLFAKGLVPFSVLLTSSMVQDGHGLLPLLSYSVKDSIKIKAFNFIFGIALGLTLFAFGF